MLLMIFLIPAAHGISISGGTSVAAQSGSLVQGNFVADAKGMTSTIISFGTNGDIDQYHYVTDATGKHAETKAYVVNGMNIEYDASILPGECNESHPKVPKSIFVSAQESLSADAADEVWVSAFASNPESDTAEVGCSISNAVNLKYDNYAKATASSAEARQSGSLNANAISFWRGAQNAEGDLVGGGPTPSGSDTVIDNGNGVSFFNSAKATKSSAESSDDVSIIGGCEKFNMGWAVANKEENRIGVGSKVINGKLTQYTTKASSKKTGTSMTFSATASGDAIDFVNQASDKWPDEDPEPSAGARSVSGVMIFDGTVKYVGSASASKNKAQSSEQLDASGGSIDASAWGRNDEMDNAHAYTAANSGSLASISGYSNKVDTKNTQTTISQLASAISATYVVFGTDTNNAKCDRSNTYGSTANNSIISGYSGMGSSSASATSASQKITSLSGSADPDIFSSVNIGADSWDFAEDHAYACAEIQNFSSVNGYSVAASSQKSQVSASESFLDVSALSGIISVFTGGEHPVDDSNYDWSYANVYLVNGALDKASKTKGAYSATSTASSKLTSSKQDIVRARSWTDRVDIFTNAHSAVLGIESQSRYNILKNGKGGIFSTSASTSSKGDAQTGAKYLGAY